MPRSNIRLCAIVPVESGIFFEKVLEGIKKAENELEKYDVKIEYFQTKHHSISRQIQLLTHAIDLRPDGIVIVPVSTTQLNFLIDEASDNDIPVVTISDDAPYSKRFCYVGPENLNCGRLCGELMGNFMGSDSKILLFSGSTEMYGLKQRVQGFKEKIKISYPNSKITKIINYNEDEHLCYKKAYEELSKNINYDGIYVTSAIGTVAVARALSELNLENPPKLIGFEPSQETAPYIYDGTINTLIYQDSFSQGYLSIKTLFDYLSSGIVPEKDFINTKIEIAMQENIEKFI